MSWTPSDNKINKSSNLISFHCPTCSRTNKQLTSWMNWMWGFRNNNRLQFQMDLSPLPEIFLHSGLFAAKILGGQTYVVVSVDFSGQGQLTLKGCAVAMYKHHLSQLPWCHCPEPIDLNTFIKKCGISILFKQPRKLMKNKLLAVERGIDWVRFCFSFLKDKMLIKNKTKHRNPQSGDMNYKHRHCVQTATVVRAAGKWESQCIMMLKNWDKHILAGQYCLVYLLLRCQR